MIHAILDKDIEKATLDNYNYEKYLNELKNRTYKENKRQRIKQEKLNKTLSEINRVINRYYMKEMFEWIGTPKPIYDDGTTIIFKVKE